jgi:glucosylceramidase
MHSPDLIRTGSFSPAFLVSLTAAMLLAVGIAGLAAESAAADPAGGVPSRGAVVKWWSSSEDLEHRLSPQPELRFRAVQASSKRVIRVDDSTTYQSVLGLGSSLEHSTCYNLHLLPAEQREHVLESLVHPDRGIGMTLMRICIGTSDFAPGPFYTYDDVPAGQEDPKLERFSIDRDREHVLPVIQAAQRLNPQLRFFASPWTPPPWMKTNGRYGGGSLRAECYPYYAEYLVRFIEAYRREGIEVHALTLQNEPEFGPEPYPSCVWTARQQRDFIRDHLGPLFRARKIQTLIWTFDHNFNHPGFPATVLRDPQAAQFVDGSAFHLYEGKPEAMSKLHREFPDKAVYFTEGSVYGAKGAAEIISYFRNWSRSYNAWVTLIDHRGKPNVSGFHDCDPTIVVINRDTLQIEYRADYFIYGQFMKFILPGAVRIASSEASGLPSNVAFKNPDGSLVLLVANAESKPCEASVVWDGSVFTSTLRAKSVATFRWAR